MSDSKLPFSLSWVSCGSWDSCSMSDQVLRLLPYRSSSVREEKRVGGKEDKEEIKMVLLWICKTDGEGM